jgi:hypothetical protein
MPIPPLNEFGLLPEGIHDCTIEELATRFGRFQQSDRRPRLWGAFGVFLKELQACDIGLAILINGSFVTARPDPNDIDVILVLPVDFELTRDLPPAEYNVVSAKVVRRRHKLDLLAARAESDQAGPLEARADQGHIEDQVMIQNEAQLQQAIEQIRNLCGALESLRTEVFPKNARNFAVLAEGPLEQIRQLQAQIGEYVERLEAVAA